MNKWLSLVGVATKAASGGIAATSSGALQLKVPPLSVILTAASEDEITTKTL